MPLLLNSLIDAGSASASGIGAGSNLKIFYSTNSSWAIPAEITKLIVAVMGGGGNGAGSGGQGLVLIEWR